MSRAVVFAPDSFKGSLSASGAAQALAEGWTTVRPDDSVVLLPMADGGEGTISTFETSVPGAQRMPVAISRPNAGLVDSDWLLLPPTDEAPQGVAVVELGCTSGIEMLGERRLPWDSDTFGFGQAIAAALDHGVSRLVLGIGSSASTDGGVGLLRALGARFMDASGAPIPRGARGLGTVARAELSGLRPLPPDGAVVLTDVSNPLLGATGAARIFGPQKGLSTANAIRVDAWLARLVSLLPADPETPGTGAGGGAGFGLLAWGAKLIAGAPEVARIIGLREALATASLVVTGEGSYDIQSAGGKAPAFVAAMAAETTVSVALVAGRIADDAATKDFVATVSLSDIAGSSSAAIAEPVRWLRKAGEILALSQD